MCLVNVGKNNILKKSCVIVAESKCLFTTSADPRTLWASYSGKSGSAEGCTSPQFIQAARACKQTAELQIQSHIILYKIICFRLSLKNLTHDY